MSEYESTTTSLVLDIQYRTIQDACVQTVDARKLHAWLRVGRDYSTWITGRIAEYGFVEHVDYLFFPQSGEKVLGRPEHMYALTLDMAKELSMVERSDRGKEARKYFIQCEKALLAVAQTITVHIDPLKEAITAIHARLDALEHIPEPTPLTRRGQLPPPAPRLKEHAEVSWHMARLWTLLRHTDEWLSNRELAHRSGIKERTARAHTRYFRQLGLVEVHEYFPNHLHRMAEDAEARNPAVYHRLNMIATLIEERRRP
jgi:phage anti-repressor protein